MTTEGTFPKINGDTLYASEINQLYNISNPFWSKYTAGSYVYKTETGDICTIGSLVFTNISGVSTININYSFDTSNWSTSEDRGTYQCGSSTIEPGKICYIDKKGTFPNGFRAMGLTYPVKENSILTFTYDLNPETAGSFWMNDIYICGGISGMIVSSSF